MSVTYTATLTVREQTLLFAPSLLHTERQRRGTRSGTRALTCLDQAVLVLRWFLDGSRLAQLATDNAIGKSTAYDYLHEGIKSLAAGPDTGVGAAGREDGRPPACQHRRHAHRDRPVRRTRPRTRRGLVVVGEARQPWRERPGPHRPDGWPLWTCEVRPGREHDTTALREHAEILPTFTVWTEDHLRVLGDLGYEGEADTITIAFKKPKGGGLSDPQKTCNKFRNGIRAIGERGNSLLMMTFKALRNVSLCPWTIGRIDAAALVLLHIGHGRTT
jgi:hypothetical protein